MTDAGVAELRGESINERTRRLIAIAHPNSERKDIGYL
jgi:acyl-CoA hydrolase